jgi:hypothetical protein
MMDELCLDANGFLAVGQRIPAFCLPGKISPLISHLWREVLDSPFTD